MPLKIYDGSCQQTPVGAFASVLSLHLW